MTLGRAAAAGLVAAVILAGMRRPWPDRAACLRLLAAAVMLVACFPGFMAMAMVTLPASHGAIVLSLLPIATAICGALILGERPSLMFWAASALGALLVLAFALRGGGALTIGDAYLVIAAISAAIGYVISGQAARTMPGWEVICWLLVLSLPVTLPASVVLFPRDFAAVPALAWLGFGYAALFSMLIGFFAWNTGLAMGGVARVSQVQLLQTFVTVGLASLVNGETIDTTTWVFTIAVVGAVIMSRLAPVKR